MLKEARIIIAKHNSLRPDEFEPSLPKVGQALAVCFGGYTRTDGNGNWFDEETDTFVAEPVVIFDVAVPDTKDSEEVLKYIVEEALDFGTQKAIYLRLPSGEVSIVSVEASYPEWGATYELVVQRNGEEKCLCRWLG